MKHLLYSKDLSRDFLETLFKRAAEFLPVLKERRSLELAKGKILATLFFEPSTRTRFSFESAMLRLGGSVISNSQMNTTSSVKKGESLQHTAQVVSRYADVIAMRHPEAGSVEEFSKGSLAPVVNGGDGANDHPTQGLLDLFTIQQRMGRLEDLTIAMVGDLKYSRVVHSQCEYLKNFGANRFILVSPQGLALPEKYVDALKSNGSTVEFTEDLESVMGEMDVLSDTRIQEERFESREEYEKYKGVYILTPELMSKAKKDMIVIDPLPILNHIDPAVDADERAIYFDQAQNGVAMRMAILAELLGL